MEKLAQKKEEGLKAAIFTFDIPPKKNVEHIEDKGAYHERGENAYF